MRVYINSKTTGKRIIVPSTLISKNAKTIWVRLPNGKIIKRNILKDLPDGLNEVIIKEEEAKPKKKLSFFEKVKLRIQELRSGHWGGQVAIH